ncbi:MAG: hypothetical protein PHV40_03565 [Candidatus Omnitrophica bacterium]|nr:hypothetical protein [Candidatus Omnitrophota bacterium]MDD5500757.1 hypothetical protein [Candidatus Omnitrophota bacterium]
MNKNLSLKIISLLLCCLFVFQQSGFAQVAALNLDAAGQLSSLRGDAETGKFRPVHLRSLSYQAHKDVFKLLLDKGNSVNFSGKPPESSARELFDYFLVGLVIPGDLFWVNLRPDSPNDIIDPLLARTDVGRILLEADLRLKKDTAYATNPQTPEGKEYWEKIYKKAGELYAGQEVVIPTLTRPWIVPGEIIIGESSDSAYIYKATLKVMLEDDYLKGSRDYSFKDPREKELNEYSSRIIKENIIPALTRKINSDKAYAPLRQVYYSLILAQWFKSRNRGKNNRYAKLIDCKDVSRLESSPAYSVFSYFNSYKESFEKGEYSIKEPVYTPHGQAVRQYFSGGISGIAPNIPRLEDGPSSGPVELVPMGRGDMQRAGSALLEEDADVTSGLGVEITPGKESAGEEDKAFPDNPVNEMAVNRINSRIDAYNRLKNSMESIISKLESGMSLSEEDISVLEEAKDRLILKNSLVAMGLKVHQGDIIVVNNQASIKFLNTAIGESQTDRIIELRQMMVRRLLSDAGLISEGSEDTLSLLFKQDKFVIRSGVVENLGEKEVLDRLALVAEQLTLDLTKFLRSEYADNELIQKYNFMFYFGVSSQVQEDSDDARILADIQALQAAKMGRCFGVRIYKFEQDKFDKLMLQANRLRGRLGLSPEEMPPADVMKEVRGRTEKDLLADAEMGIDNADRRLFVKEYLDIIDLFDYQKYWRANKVRRTKEKEGLLRILEGLESITSRGPPQASARERADIARDALTVIGTNPKNHRVTSGEAFLAAAAELSGREEGRLVAVDVIGFWADIQKNLARAHRQYMEKTAEGEADKEKLIMDLSLEADDLIKREMAVKLSALNDIVGNYIPSVMVGNETRILANQEGGDEIIFYMHGDYDWDALAYAMSGAGLGVRIAASCPGRDDFGGAYVVAQESDNKLKAFEGMGVYSAVVSLEQDGKGSMEWVVYYQNKKSGYEDFYRDLAEKNKDAPDNDMDEAFGFDTVSLSIGQESQLEEMYNDRHTFLIRDGKAVPDKVTEKFRPKFRRVFSLVAAARIKKDDVVLDPFAGSGGMGFMVATLANPRKVMLTDISYGSPANGIEIAIRENLEEWKKLVSELSSLLGREVRLSDITYGGDSAQELSSVADSSVTKIISDPPRGEGTNGAMSIDDNRAYEIFVNSLSAASRVLVDGGEAYYIIPQRWRLALSRDERVETSDFRIDGFTDFFEGSKTALIKFKKTFSSFSPDQDDSLPAMDKGGIDFRSLPVVSRSLDNLKVNLRGMIYDAPAKPDLPREWSGIERMINAGIIPSPERIKDYFAASYLEKNIDRDKGKLVSCIAEILRMEEEDYAVTDPVLRDLLAVLGSGISYNDLKESFRDLKRSAEF